MTGVEYSRGDRVRFQPPGFNRDEREGEIFLVRPNPDFGVTYYVAEDDGHRYQLGPGAIIGRADSDEGVSA